MPFPKMNKQRQQDIQNSSLLKSLQLRHWFTNKHKRPYIMHCNMHGKCDTSMFLYNLRYTHTHTQTQLADVGSWLKGPLILQQRKIYSNDQTKKLFTVICSILEHITVKSSLHKKVNESRSTRESQNYTSTEILTED